MKSVNIAIGIAAAMAVSSVGFEARAATFLTKAECMALAKAHYASLVAACSTKSGFAYDRCMMEANADYGMAMVICFASPAPAVPPAAPYGPALPPTPYKPPAGPGPWMPHGYR